MVRNHGLWEGARFVKSCPAVFSFPLLSCQVLPRSAMGSDNWICPASDRAMLGSGCIQRVFERQDASLQGFVSIMGAKRKSNPGSAPTPSKTGKKAAPGTPVLDTAALHLPHVEMFTSWLPRPLLISLKASLFVCGASGNLNPSSFQA